jgi:transposase InsO family protein
LRQFDRINTISEHPAIARIGVHTSYAFGKRCREAGVMPSMGTVGDAYDNAMAESFFATLERELLSRRRFKSQAEAKMAVFTRDSTVAHM